MAKTWSFRVGALHLRRAFSPVEGYRLHYTPAVRLRSGATWLLEWRHYWLWWHPRSQRQQDPHGV